MKIKYLQKAESIRDVRDQIMQSRVLGIDTETTDLDPLKGELRLLQVSPTPDTSIIFDLKKIDPRSTELDFLRDTFESPNFVKMFHNAKFDLKWLKKHFGVGMTECVFDSYLGSQLINPDEIMINHNLKDVAARYAFTDLTKGFGKSDWSGDISDDQLRYAAFDSTTLHPIREKMNQHFDAGDLRRVALIEFNAVDQVAELELAGFYLDEAMWMSRANQDEVVKAQLAAKLHEAFEKVSDQQNFFGGSQFNLDSTDDIRDALIKLGVPLDANASTQAFRIDHLKEKHPIVADVIAYREAAQAVKTYGRAYPDFISPKTRRVHADFRQIGAPTGRFSCAEPNLQQIPHEDEYRHCFKAQGDGRRLIIDDYSQIELRIMTQFSRDPKLMHAYLNDADLHAQTAKEVGVDRDLGKRLNFGTAFGIAAKRFSLVSGLKEKESEKVLKKFWEVYSVLDSYQKENERIAREDREMRSWSGRTLRIDFNLQDRSAIGAIERLGRNLPIQGTCSDILKRFLYLWNRKRREFNNADLVNIVHDEVITECDADQAEEVIKAQEQCMIDAGNEVLTVIPCKVEGKISTKWEK
jgi:DNA polymerase I-like protein with 3'-5' exonuclease and polymerase domains